MSKYLASIYHHLFLTHPSHKPNSIVIQLQVTQKPVSVSEVIYALAPSTYHPGNGCCISCRRLQHHLYGQIPPRPPPPSLIVLVLGHHTHRTIPVDKQKRTQSYEPMKCVFLEIIPNMCSQTFGIDLRYIIYQYISASC